MIEHTLHFSATVWQYHGKAAWFFVTLPNDTAADIRFFYPHRHGFGSVPVVVKLGTSTWKTSVFPDSASGSFLLPLKADIRSKEGLKEGTLVSVSLTLTP